MKKKTLKACKGLGEFSICNAFRKWVKIKYRSQFPISLGKNRAQKRRPQAKKKAEVNSMTIVRTTFRNEVNQRLYVQM